MEGLSLTCLGVGDGSANADRDHAACLYRLGGVSLLVDCGEPVSRSLKALGLSSELIDGIFLSHLHSDHVGGLFMLLQGFWLEQRYKELPVHLPADGIGPIRRMLQAAYLFDELLPFHLRLEALRAGQPVMTGPVRVTPYRTSHLDQLRWRFQAKYPGEYAAYCFLIEAEDRRIGHSADLGAPEDLEPLLGQPLDLLVCEMAHFSPEAAFAYLRGRPIRHLVFTHLHRPFWENLDAIRRLAASQLPGIKLSFPHDRETLPL